MQIFPARFHQKIKSRIFFKSARKGQLKNVQDGISRPLGSREIQKTKVETVLRDTLYNAPHNYLARLINQNYRQIVNNAVHQTLKKQAILGTCGL